MKLYYYVISILIIFSGTFTYHQTDYHLIVERVNITFFNKSYMSNAKAVTYYFTRHSKRYNISFDFLQDLDTHFVTLYVEGRKFQSNEYRLFPMNYTENVCTSMSYSQFGDNRVDSFETNFDMKCLIKHGHYYVNNIHYNDSTFPPFAPRGRYLLIGYLMHKKTILLGRTETYIEIKPQNPLERVIGV